MQLWLRAHLLKLRARNWSFFIVASKIISLSLYVYTYIDILYIYICIHLYYAILIYNTHNCGPRTNRIPRLHPPISQSCPVRPAVLHKGSDIVHHIIHTNNVVTSGEPWRNHGESWGTLLLLTSENWSRLIQAEWCLELVNAALYLWPLGPAETFRETATKGCERVKLQGPNLDEMAKALPLHWWFHAATTLPLARPRPTVGWSHPWNFNGRPRRFPTTSQPFNALSNKHLAILCFSQF